MKRSIGLFGLPLLVLWMAPAFAVIETYEFSDPALEQRYHDLSAELRCPKCQNQNIADSNAPIAQDLRGLLYKQLEAGAGDEQIKQYMVDRYGEFVLYRPRFGGATTILWLAPALLLALGVLIAAMTLRGRRKVTRNKSDELSDDQRKRLDELMAKADQNK